MHRPKPGMHAEHGIEGCEHFLDEGVGGSGLRLRTVRHAILLSDFAALGRDYCPQ
jgi:hypothetical protein